MDGITFQKLRDIEARHAEVEAAMSDPAVVQDQGAYQKLARARPGFTAFGVSWPPRRCP